MRIVFCFFLLLTQLYGFDGLEGCFETIQANGKLVKLPQELKRRFSFIKSKKSSVFYDLVDERPIDILFISSLTNYDGYWFSYSNYILPLSGEFKQIDGDRIVYSFDQDLLLEDQFRLIRVDHKVDVEFIWINENQLFMNLSFSSKERNLFYQDIILLRKIGCDIL